MGLEGDSEENGKGRKDEQYQIFDEQPVSCNPPIFFLFMFDKSLTISSQGL